MIPNTTQTPNIIFNGLMRKMNDTEFRIVMLVVRATLGKTLKIALKSYTPDEIMDMISFYLDSEKADRVGVTLKSIFTSHSVNQWQQNAYKHKFI